MTNNDQMLILCLSYFITTVMKLLLIFVTLIVNEKNHSMFFVIMDILKLLKIVLNIYKKHTNTFTFLAIMFFDVSSTAVSPIIFTAFIIVDVITETITDPIEVTSLTAVSTIILTCLFVVDIITNSITYF